MRLAEIIGYQLDVTRCAALRSLYRQLADSPFRPADTTALLLVRDQPGCDQTALGRVLAGNRTVGMKVASRLEAQGLFDGSRKRVLAPYPRAVGVVTSPGAAALHDVLSALAGRDRRSRGLFITTRGESVLADLLDRHQRAEARIATHLEPGEGAFLLQLLGKVQQAVDEEDAEFRGDSSALEPIGQTAQHAGV